MESESLAEHFLHAIGFRFGLIFLVTSLVSTLLIVFVLLKGKGPFAAASLLIFVALPFATGLFWTLLGITTSLPHVLNVPTEPQLSELMHAFASSLVSTFLGLLISMTLAVLTGLASIFELMRIPSSGSQKAAALGGDDESTLV